MSLSGWIWSCQGSSVVVLRAVESREEEEEVTSPVGGEPVCPERKVLDFFVPVQ